MLLQFTVLGETAKRVSSEFRNAHSEIPWRKIMGLRDVVVHDYFHIDVRRAWKIASLDIPELIDALEPLVPPESAV
ncbi:MAG: DUF86 domain-containing protein [Nitrospiraceae bacterium]|nr:DUF86 domain-containing protein [Nitrospiraceae bacterium]